jgi:hypothetical protein
MLRYFRMKSKGARRDGTLSSFVLVAPSSQSKKCQTGRPKSRKRWQNGRQDSPQWIPNPCATSPKLRVSRTPRTGAHRLLIDVVKVLLRRKCNMANRIGPHPSDTSGAPPGLPAGRAGLTLGSNRHRAAFSSLRMTGAPPCTRLAQLLAQHCGRSAARGPDLLSRSSQRVKPRASKRLSSGRTNRRQLRQQPLQSHRGAPPRPVLPSFTWPRPVGRYGRQPRAHGAAWSVDARCHR